MIRFPFLRPVAAASLLAAALAPATSAAQTAAPVTVPAGAATFQPFGPWEFKVDAISRGPDGHIQMIVTVRNASNRQMPFTITDIDAHLIDANGRSVQRHGNLYRVTPDGPVAALVNAGSSYLEPGDQIRGRLLFPNTKEFAPVQLRLREPVKSQTVVTHPMN
jgi:hypothetical protein